jgi:hypothetical protein
MQQWHLCCMIYPLVLSPSQCAPDILKGSWHRAGSFGSVLQPLPWVACSLSARPPNINLCHPFCASPWASFWALPLWARVRICAAPKPPPQPISRPGLHPAASLPPLGQFMQPKCSMACWVPPLPLWAWINRNRRLGAIELAGASDCSGGLDRLLPHTRPCCFA